MTAPRLRVLTDNLLAYLRTSSGKQVGDHDAPDAPVLPYGILYVLDASDFDGPTYADPESILRLPFQVTVVGAERTACQWLGDRIQDALVARDLVGRRLSSPDLVDLDVLDVAILGRAMPNREGVLWSAPDRYEIAVTAST